MTRKSESHREAAAPSDGPRYPIESVDNALRLLLLLPERGSIGVSEASEYLEVAPSTAHRLLAMLQHHQLALRDPVSKTYVAGPSLMRLGLAALKDVDVRSAARPFIERLAGKVGETTHLGLLYGTGLAFIDCVEGPKALRAGSRTGEILPAHCTAGGKALLAELSDERITELYPDERLAALTRRSIVTRRALLAALEAIRARGYALNDGESESELRAVAAAVRDATGRPRCSVTVAAPAGRLPDHRLPVVSTAVRQTVEAIGAVLT